MIKCNVFDCTVVELDKHHSDRKGNLTVVENGITAQVAKELPSFAVCLKNNTEFADCQFKIYVTIDGFNVPKLHELIENSKL